MKLLWVAIFHSIPFGLAAILELRSELRVAQKIRNLFPVILGLGIVAVSYGAARFTDASSNYAHSGLVHWIAFLSALVGSSGAFIKYSRRSSAILIAVGGLALAFLWIFFGEPRY